MISTIFNMNVILKINLS